MEAGWDQKIAAKLREEKLTQEQIGFVLGLIAEQRNLMRMIQIRGSAMDAVSLRRTMRDRRKKMVGKKLRRIKRYLKRLA